MKKYIAIIILFIGFSSVKAQTLVPELGGQRAGISTAQFLKIGIGARATAMGEAFVAVANDVSALYWNPAGLVQDSVNQIYFSHNEWVVDTKSEFFGAVYHLTSNDAVGIAFTSLHMADMPVTTEFMPFGTGEYFTVSDFAVGVTYSKKLTSQFSFGGTFRFFQSTLAELKMRGVMIDLGTYYWTGLSTIRFAVTVSNFGNNVSPEGSATLTDKSKKDSWQEFSLPSMFRFGLAMEPILTDEHRLTTSVQLNHPNDNSESVSLGAEYSWKEIFYLRAGYIFNAPPKDITFGAGLKIPTSIANVKFDYSFMNLDELGDSHRISIILGLY